MKALKRAEKEAHKEIKLKEKAANFEAKFGMSKEQHLELKQARNAEKAANKEIKLQEKAVRKAEKAECKAEKKEKNVLTFNANQITALQSKGFTTEQIADMQKAIEVEP